MGPRARHARAAGGIGAARSPRSTSVAGQCRGRCAPAPGPGAARRTPRTAYGGSKLRCLRRASGRVRARDLRGVSARRGGSAPPALGGLDPPWPCRPSVQRGGRGPTCAGVRWLEPAGSSVAAWLQGASARGGETGPRLLAAGDRRRVRRRRVLTTPFKAQSRPEPDTSRAERRPTGLTSTHQACQTAKVALSPSGRAAGRSACPVRWGSARQPSGSAGLCAAGTNDTPHPNQTTGPQSAGARPLAGRPPPAPKWAAPSTPTVGTCWRPCARDVAP